MNELEKIKEKNNLKSVIKKIFEYSEFKFRPNVMSLKDDIYLKVDCGFKLSVEEYEEILKFKEWLENDY